ncbi:hypothetical protein PFISCL1PPCAC_17566 [Pristionchus fissidentatus]|uniref:Uncharacterized protein n=1 Tax=Pristionchus fissidentatus TaxID=1538716 RepID=A0AAV5W2W7_9BILA|nr:hypothetical protein PFISCL1PPCAC_17566 [Pristionchus fissidentatus]
MHRFTLAVLLSLHSPLLVLSNQYKVTGPLTPHFVDWLQKNGYTDDFVRADLMITQGSYGGRSSDGQQITKTPIVMIHGNSDAALRQGFTHDYRLYTQAELYATSWGDTNPLYSASRKHDCATTQRLRRFLIAVQAYTGAEKISFITHSMGVTLGRKIIKGGKIQASDGNCDLGAPLRYVDVFVGLAGANYGLCNCEGVGTAEPTCNKQDGLWPGDSCGMNYMDCGLAVMPFPCSGPTYSAFLTDLNNDMEQEAKRVVSAWSSSDDLIMYGTMTWGKTTCLIPRSTDKKTYLTFSHMETKELTYEDQFNWLNGSWFVIARKCPTVDYLPQGINSSLIRLIADERDLIMEEYHSINGTCMPQMHGRWRRSNESDGYQMEVRNPTGSMFTMFLRVIFHTLSGEKNEEMNMVMFGCRNRNSDGSCAPADVSASILSNSRHPQTLALFQSAKHIEDYACIDALEMKTFNTYIVKCSQDSTFVDVECRVENWKGFVNVTKFYDEPRILTVIAYIDPLLDGQQIAHISCHYSSTTKAECEWIRQRQCFKTSLTQSFESDHRVKATTEFTAMNGTVLRADFTGSVIWQNGDEFVSIECLHIEEDDGSCESYRIYVWSDEDHMDQPTLREIYNVLHTFCIDPTELIFLNTFHECRNESESAAVACSVPPGWTPVGTNILQGTWYFAADVNGEPKIFMQSVVIQLSPAQDDPTLMHLTFYAQKESDRECMGPGTGTVQLLNDSTLEVTIEYRYKLVPTYKNRITWKSRIIYLDNQRMVLYRCLKEAANGSCTQNDLDVLVRSRYVSSNDVSVMLPYLERACVPRQRLRWFDLHSSCGRDVIASTRLRRDMVTMSHSQVLDILTNVQEPRCGYGNLRGVRVDLDTMEKAGVWYLISVYDRLPHDTFALILRVIKPKQCYTLVFGVHGWEKRNAKGESDWIYEMHHRDSSNRSNTMVLRFLFFNSHVGVLYSCLGYGADGKCAEGGLYVISRHISIDHAELTVLETVSRAVCMDPAKLYHTAAHDFCVYDPTKVKLPACAVIEKVNEDMFVRASVDDLFWTSANSTADEIWERAVNESSDTPLPPLLKFDSIIDDGLFYAIASLNPETRPIALMRNGSDFVKIFETESGCGYAKTEVRTLTTFPNVALIGSQLLLLSRLPYPPNADLRRRKGQRSAAMPCLHLIERSTPSKCEILTPPQCSTSHPIWIAEQLHGEWQLYSSDPYVSANARCIISSPTLDEFEFSCHSESWQGECEREVKTRIRADAWGGYERLPPKEMEASDDSSESAPVNNEIPVRVPSELFERGNLTVADNYLLLVSEDALVGRRYSLWLRAGGDSSAQLAAAPRPLTRRDARDIARACVRPRRQHLRTRELAC